MITMLLELQNFITPPRTIDTLFSLSHLLNLKKTSFLVLLLCLLHYVNYSFDKNISLLNTILLIALAWNKIVCNTPD